VSDEPDLTHSLPAHEIGWNDPERTRAALLRAIEALQDIYQYNGGGRSATLRTFARAAMDDITAIQFKGADAIPCNMPFKRDSE
jgi:hypothetical protein